jgi:hypothetical protein
MQLEENKKARSRGPHWTHSKKEQIVMPTIRRRFLALRGV